MELNRLRLFGAQRQEFNDTGGKLSCLKYIYIKQCGKRNGGLVLFNLEYY